MLIPWVHAGAVSNADSSSLRITMEAHAPEGVFGTTLPYENASYVVGLFLIYLIANGLWSAPEESWLGILRRLFARNEAKELFISVALYFQKNLESRGQSESKAIITLCSGKKLELYTKEMLPKYADVEVHSKEFGTFRARVKSCQPIANDPGWFLLRLEILKPYRRIFADFEALFGAFSARSCLV